LNWSKVNTNCFVTASRDGYIRYYDKRDITNGKPIFKYLGHSNEMGPSKMNSIEFSMDDIRLLSSGRDNCIKLWDIRKISNKETPKSLKVYESHKCKSYNVSCLFFNNENNILTGSEDNSLYIYNTNTGEVVNKIEDHSSVVK
jgi:COMPASS component SWD3